MLTLTKVATKLKNFSKSIQARIPLVLFPTGLRLAVTALRASLFVRITFMIKAQSGLRGNAEENIETKPNSVT